MKSNVQSLDLLASSSTTLTKSTIVDEDKRERVILHLQIEVKGNPLHLIMGNDSQKKFVSKDIMKKMGHIENPHQYP
jgi:hypothetical protein